MTGNQYTNPKRYYNYPEYSVWVNMRRRCRENILYTKRGIKVCHKWQNSFEDFIQDMGRRPSNNHSIDRIDNDKNYEPGNCRWALMKTQALNRSTSHMISHNGRTQNMSLWAEELGMSRQKLTYRIKAGWSPERALKW